MLFIEIISLVFLFFLFFERQFCLYHFFLFLFVFVEFCNPFVVDVSSFFCLWLWTKGVIQECLEFSECFSSTFLVFRSFHSFKIIYKLCNFSVDNHGCERSEFFYLFFEIRTGFLLLLNVPSLV